MNITTTGHFEVDSCDNRVILSFGPMKLRMPACVARALAHKLDTAGALMEEREAQARRAFEAASAQC